MAVLEMLVLSLTWQAEQEVAAGEILNVAIKKQCQIFISTKFIKIKDPLVAVIHSPALADESENRLPTLKSFCLMKINYPGEVTTSKSNLEGRWTSI